MITEHGNFNVNCNPRDFIGLSTDTKPMNVTNTSSFYEMDTRKLFLYDGQNNVWLEQ
jgi:hypothetical protein